MTITDPQGGRWTIEQEARRANILDELRRDCHLCQRSITGAREAHTVSHCAAHAQPRLEPDTVAAMASGAQEVAWDYTELLDLLNYATHIDLAPAAAGRGMAWLYSPTQGTDGHGRCHWVVGARHNGRGT